MTKGKYLVLKENEKLQTEQLSWKPEDKNHLIYSGVNYKARACDTTS